MQDKDYDQALQELAERNNPGLKKALEERQPRLPHNTVASLVADMPEGSLKEEVTDLLKFMKVMGSLDALKKLAKWSKAEYREIDDYIVEIHLKSRHSKIE